MKLFVKMSKQFSAFMVNIYDQLWDIPRYLLSRPCTYMMLQRMRCTCSFPLLNSPCYYLKIFRPFTNSSAFFFKCLQGFFFFFQNVIHYRSFYSVKSSFCLSLTTHAAVPFPQAFSWIFETLLHQETRTRSTENLRKLQILRRFWGDNP